MNILNDEQTQEFIQRVGVVYRNFKKINSGDWKDCEAYKMGIIDFCDSLIFVSSQITYEVSTMRTEVECLLDEIDNEGE